MRFGSLFSFRDIKRVPPPKTPYIDSVWNLWCGKIYHIENYYREDGKKIEWTSNPNMFPHFYNGEFGQLEELTPHIAWQSCQAGYFGENPDIERVVKCFNDQ